jgi:3-polyprenyl-4-hydroxybenzoate decarboxylase
MQQELRKRISSLPKNMRSISNIAKVIAEPAPSFYLSPRRIYDFLYQVYAKNNRRKQA